MLDLNAVRKTAMRETPYRWAQPSNPVRENLWRDLIDSFPPESWFKEVGDDRILIGPVINQRLGLSGPLTVAPIWARLIAAFCALDYRRSLERLTGICLENDLLQFNFNRYNPGNWSHPHLDSPHNSLVHLLYFNEQWLSDWGGLLSILHGEDQASLYQNVLPDIRSSIVLVPSANSWHMVTPIASVAPRARLSFKITFLKPSAFEADIYDFHRRNGIPIHQI